MNTSCSVEWILYCFGCQVEQGNSLSVLISSKKCFKSLFWRFVPWKNTKFSVPTLKNRNVEWNENSDCFLEQFGHGWHIQ